VSNTPQGLAIASPPSDTKCPQCKRPATMTSPLVFVPPELHRLVGGVWAHYGCFSRLATAVAARRVAQQGRRS
jgi:hypothetical protein